MEDSFYLQQNMHVLKANKQVVCIFEYDLDEI